MGTFAHFFPTFRENKSVFRHDSTGSTQKSVSPLDNERRNAFLLRLFLSLSGQTGEKLQNASLSVEHPLLDGMGYAVFVVGQRDEIGHGLHFVGGISHRHTHAGKTQHGEVVETVAERDELLAR